MLTYTDNHRALFGYAFQACFRKSRHKTLCLFSSEVLYISNTAVIFPDPPISPALLLERSKREEY